MMYLFISVTRCPGDGGVKVGDKTSVYRLTG